MTLSVNPAYHAYIRSPAWERVRQAKFAQVGRRCQNCGGDERLEVHHMTYDRFQKERLEDLQVLCHLCHAHEHGRAPDVGPIAGLTGADHVLRGIGPRLLQRQREVLHAVTLEGLAVQTDQELSLVGAYLQGVALLPG